MKATTRRIRPWRPAALTLMFAAGCGFGPSGRPADPSQAETALHAALDSWKGGEKPDELAGRNPPIHVADVDWRRGYRLERYGLGSDTRLVGFDVNIPVVLELKDARGKSIKRNATYAVATNPALTVVRQEN